MTMTAQHKEKIASGVKKYHECARSHGCGKKAPVKKAPVKPIKVPKPVNKKVKNIVAVKKPKKVVKKPIVKKVSLLKLEDKKPVQPIKAVKIYKVDAGKRSAGNRMMKQTFKKTSNVILGLKSTATPEEVKKQYKKLALKFHPDKATGDKNMFQAIGVAQKVMLSSIEKKVNGKYTLDY